jgi:hypothetical protein
MSRSVTASATSAGIWRQLHVPSLTRMGIQQGSAVVCGPLSTEPIPKWSRRLVWRPRELGSRLSRHGIEMARTSFLPRARTTLRRIPEDSGQGVPPRSARPGNSIRGYTTRPTWIDLLVGSRNRSSVSLVRCHPPIPWKPAFDRSGTRLVCGQTVFGPGQTGEHPLSG